MSARPPLSGVQSVLEAAAAEAGRLLGKGPLPAVLLRGRRGEPELVGASPLPEAVVQALALEGGGTLGAMARRGEGPLLLRASALPGESDGVAAALRAEAIEGLALLPLRGEAGVVACVVVPVPAGWEWPAAGGRRGLVSLAPTLLQVAAGSAALEALADPPGGFAGGRPGGVVVVDGSERVILAEGNVREALEWRRPDPFGRPLTELPSAHLRGAASTVREAGPEGGRILLLGSAGPPEPGAAGPWPLRLAARVHAAAGTVARALHARDGHPGPASGLLGLAADVTHRARALARSVAEQAASGGEGGVDLAEVASAVLDDHAEGLARARIRVLSFIAPAPCPAPEDLLALSGVLRALVARARSTLAPAGGGTLTVRTWMEEGWACAAVSDDGSASRAGAGEGAGAAAGAPEDGEGPLDEAAAVVESLGGRFNVERRPGVWNRCTLMIPTAPARASAPRPTETRVRRDAHGGLSVLVVDDNPALRSVLRRYLERRGHRVTEAADGDDALRVVGRGDAFDRLIVDIQMPGRSGPELFGTLSSVAPELCGRTLFMTGDLMEATTERFLAQSGRPAIAKPFDLADLARKLEGAA